MRKWKAAIKVEGRVVDLGEHHSKEEARAAKAAALRLWQMLEDHISVHLSWEEA